LLALVHAIDGRLEAAQALATLVLDDPRAVCRPTGTVTALLARVLCSAQQGQPTVSERLMAAVEPTLELSQAVRCVEHVVRSALAATSPAGVDGHAARHPLARRALLALGVLEVVDVEGSLVVAEGPAETALRGARAARAGGSPARVIEVLQPFVDGTVVDLDAHPRTIAEIDVMTAIAASAQGRPDLAASSLDRSLNHVATHGIVAPLQLDASRLTELLSDIVRESRPHREAAVRLLDTVREMSLPVFLEPLTRQETAVLAYLPTLMSNVEIARTMNLSVNTVKTHLKALYRKLGVERRRDAVVRARQRELI
jgi:LuxR family maltose regulon positive regulatory protein